MSLNYLADFPIIYKKHNVLFPQNTAWDITSFGINLPKLLGYMIRKKLEVRYLLGKQNIEVV